MCSVGQPEGSAVVLLVQLGLLVVEMTDSLADLSTLLQSLSVLWKLKDKQQGLRGGPMCDLLPIKHIRPEFLSSTYTGEGFLVLLCL